MATKRGRPSKKAAEAEKDVPADDVAEDVEDEVEDEPVAKKTKETDAPKRGRGRPKGTFKKGKKKTAPRDPNAPKRGRGRPKQS